MRRACHSGTLALRKELSRLKLAFSVFRAWLHVLLKWGGLVLEG